MKFNGVAIVALTGGAFVASTLAAPIAYDSEAIQARGFAEVDTEDLVMLVSRSVPATHPSPAHAPGTGGGAPGHAAPGHPHTSDAGATHPGGPKPTDPSPGKPAPGGTPGSKAPPRKGMSLAQIEARLKEVGVNRVSTNKDGHTVWHMKNGNKITMRKPLAGGMEKAHEMAGLPHNPSGGSGGSGHPHGGGGGSGAGSPHSGGGGSGAGSRTAAAAAAAAAAMVRPVVLTVTVAVRPPLGLADLATRAGPVTPALAALAVRAAALLAVIPLDPALGPELSRPESRLCIQLPDKGETEGVPERRQLRSHSPSTRTRCSLSIFRMGAANLACTAVVVNLLHGDISTTTSESVMMTCCQTLVPSPPSGSPLVLAAGLFFSWT